MNKDYAFILPIFDDRREYVLGFEAGKIYEQIRSGQEIDGLPIHKENRAQVEMICVHFEAEYRFEDSTDGWTILYAKQIGAPTNGK